jgi:hypothetical protein
MRDVRWPVNGVYAAKPTLLGGVGVVSGVDRESYWRVCFC